MSRTENKKNPIINKTPKLIDTRLIFNSTKKNTDMQTLLPLGYKINTKTSQNKVVGWLIAINGKQMGNSFNIYNQSNYLIIGTDKKARILSVKDESKYLKAEIVHNSENSTYISKLNDDYTLKVNSQPVAYKIILNDYDIIDIDSYKFTYRSLCNDKFSWETISDNKKPAT